MAIRPFVKWAGGKGQLLLELKKLYPKDLGTHITKYCEPFVGGGAVLFDILSNYQLREVYISDVNSALINTYQVLQRRCDELIDALQAHKAAYLKASDRRAYYYEARSGFNTLDHTVSADSQLQKAALFLFLNKTCFNGLYRVNRSGAFNVPAGAYQNPSILDADQLRQISALLQKVIIVCGDYRQSDSFIDGQTFVYFDPPYRPLGPTANFTAYTQDGFTDESQRELAAFVHVLAERGAKVIVSNSDPKNADASDDFFDQLYAPFYIHRADAARMINRNAARRGKISELIITTYEP